MIRALLLVLALALPAAAETARVVSGEHADFTRLVIELPVPGGWTVGRTAMGYGFAVAEGSPPVFDLTAVWDRIPRTRLQALRVDGATGALQLALACACHVFPFEYQPGTVVLDIRDGPPPPGSAFEAAFSPAPEAARAGPPLTSADQRGYDWLDRARAGTGRPAPVDLRLPLAPESADLGPLRDALLLQISRGAADGVVDMELPGKPAKGEDLSDLDLGNVRIGLGELPGIATGDGDLGAPDRLPDGGACLPDDGLDVAGWGGGRPAPDLLAEARGGLYGEFDTLQPGAVLQAVKLHLYLGFGAEALQYAALLPAADQDPELAPFLSMARLIDGDSDPGTPFAPMLGCDGAAALWAALAYAGLPAGTQVNADAVVRSFQALPAHLRRHLGAALADRLMPRDAEAARMIRDAMERTPDMPAGTVALLDAKADLQADRPDAALAHAETAVADGGGTPDALIALVEAHFRASQPLSTEVAEALQSLHETSPDAEGGPAQHRALVLALALSGQVDAAFALADAKGPEMADLWQVLAERADDGALLSHAVLPSGSTAPVVADEVALALALRLLDLGFPEPALAWLGPIETGAAPPRRLLAARAELGRGDARRAVALLTGIEGPEADGLRASAQTQLGDIDAARTALIAADQPDAAARIAPWAADWPRLPTDVAEVWATAAGYAGAAPVPEGGPLARGAALLADSVAARSAVTALLADIPAAGP